MDFEKPSIAAGFIFKEPISVGPHDVNTNLSQTSFVFLVPKDTSDFQLIFPRAESISISLKGESIEL